MRLATYLSGSHEVPVIVVGIRLCPLADAVTGAGLGGGIDATSVRGLLGTSGRADWVRLAASAAQLVDANPSGFPSIESVALLPPVPDPQKILCLALNSTAHCEEVGVPRPAIPWFFPKWPTSLVGHRATVHPAPAVTQLDWEGEIAVVIGAPAKCVPAEHAVEYVAGVSILNDLSARNLIHGIETIAVTKAGDAQAPCGPVLVTLDEVGDLTDLRYRTLVNGIVKQDGSTSDYIFGIGEAIASISRVITLVPGDIISMGTLPGVGLCRSPQEFLTDGDVVDIEVDGVGTLRTTIGSPSAAPNLGPTPGKAGQMTVAASTVEGSPVDGSHAARR
jgi:2-keto-4-pentenoate hydratase/2-oxohepta-3-ene-1,7-dioic acid hydratase in catechol pathway